MQWFDTAVVCVARPSDEAEPLRLESRSAKVFVVDERVAVVFSGLAADGRVLANQLRLECQLLRGGSLEGILVEVPSAVPCAI